MTILLDAEMACKEERVSETVCLLLEKSRSTETLTPGIARISLAMRDKMGNIRQ